MPSDSRSGTTGPSVTIRAPGRVNLIGDHTDYQEGLCLPVAIDREIVVRATGRSDLVVRAQSEAATGTVEVAGDGTSDVGTVEPSWGRAVAAVLTGLAEDHQLTRGFDAAVSSTVPLGAGLSSSAAFMVAFALAVATMNDLPINPRELALVAQAAEHRASGVPCGVMDQMASVFGRAGHALLLDCRTLEVEAVALPDAVAIAVVHSGVPRRLEDSAYAKRRAACEAAAARAGVAMLRDATREQVAGDPFARHVVSENERVSQFVDALRAGDADRCGQLMGESHASLRDDFQVSTPELDILVTELTAAGAYGARLTGAGFGGCVIALVATERVETVVARAAARYGAATGLTPTPFVVRAVDGAGIVE